MTDLICKSVPGADAAKISVLLQEKAWTEEYFKTMKVFVGKLTWVMGTDVLKTLMKLDNFTTWCGHLENIVVFLRGDDKEEEMSEMLQKQLPKVSAKKFFIFKNLPKA